MLCPWGCGADIQKIVLESTGRKLWLNWSGLVHNCPPRQDFKEEYKERLAKQQRDQDKEAAELKRKLREPVYTFARELKLLQNYEYLEHGKLGQSLVRELCSCGPADIFPVWRRAKQFYFDSDKLTGIKDNFFCASCGLDLTEKNKRRYYPQYSAI